MKVFVVVIKVLVMTVMTTTVMVVVVMTIIRVIATLVEGLIVMVKANEVVLRGGVMSWVQVIISHKMQIMEADQGFRNSVGFWMSWLI